MSVGRGHLGRRKCALVTTDADAAQVPAETAKGLQMKLRVVDLQGREISEVAAGSEFQLQLIVQDHRLDARVKGAFSAFADVVYRSELMRLTDGAVTNYQKGPSYPVVAGFDASVDGLLDELGGVSDSLTGLDGEEHLVASVKFLATEAGTARFGIDPADDTTQHAMLAYGESDVHQHTVYVGTTLTIKTPDGRVVQDDHWQPVESTTSGAATGDLVITCHLQQEPDASSDGQYAYESETALETAIPWLTPIRAGIEPSIASEMANQFFARLTTSGPAFPETALDDVGIPYAFSQSQRAAESSPWTRSETSDDDEPVWLEVRTDQSESPSAARGSSALPVAPMVPLFY